ncbi:MAG: DNA replication/repair protein RecF [Chloroflexi bacterium]|nr:DNA replication/repair protein RecF [Chloroflexota bacterium]
MHLAKLTLLNFRNFRNVTIELQPGLTVIQGANGQGKSNLLEAVFLLSIAKSPRVVTDRALVNWDTAAAGGHAQILGYARQAESTIQVQIDFEVRGSGTGDDAQKANDSPALQKSLRVDGIPRTASEFVGTMNVVAFAAEDIELVSGPPAERRKYLDILISQTDNAYLRTLQRYNRVVIQRNHLLRLVRERRAGEDELAFWNERLATEGAAIVDRRRRAIERLSTFVVPAHQELAGVGQQLGIEYLPKLGAENVPAPGVGTRELAGMIARGAESLRDRELAQSQTVVGPHRDEMQLTIAGHPAGTFASRGQARTIALALRLAEAGFVEDGTSRKPVLALDDVLSELDESRRIRVLEAALRFDQALLSTTDFGLVDDRFLARSACLAIKSAAVERVSCAPAPEARI